MWYQAKSHEEELWFHLAEELRGQCRSLLRAGQVSECKAAGGLTPPYPSVIG